MTPFGDPSILYTELPKDTNGDKGNALRAKAMAYNGRFMRAFGID